jgi:hypothetical protein
MFRYTGIDLFLFYYAKYYEILYPYFFSEKRLMLKMFERMGREKHSDWINLGTK